MYSYKVYDYTSYVNEVGEGLFIWWRSYIFYVCVNLPKHYQHIRYTLSLNQYSEVSSELLCLLSIRVLIFFKISIEDWTPRIIGLMCFDNYWLSIKKLVSQDNYSARYKRRLKICTVEVDLISGRSIRTFSDPEP